MAPLPPPSCVTISHVKRLAACVLAVPLIAAPPAGAYAIGGHPWPEAEVTYFTIASAYRAGVDRAARAWNRAGVGVRLVRAPDRRADVLIAYGGAPCGGAAPVGSPRRRAERTVMRLGAGCDRRWITLTAVHEFGHVIGLDHESGPCARMSPGVHADGTPWGCPRRPLAEWVRSPLLRDDLRGARALYRPRAFDGSSSGQ